MTSKYNRSIMLYFIFNICFSFLAVAQESVVDSTTIIPDKVQSIAYGKQPSWMVSSSISTIKGTDLQKSFTSNLANTLYGRLAGLTVRQGGGEPGLDSPSLNVRGISTFAGNNDILILVDGFESSFEQLNSQEIESINLLKDASATAIYGSRGANGVLLVNTRRGSHGPLKVNFSVQHGYQSPGKMAEFLGSYDYARLYNEGLKNDGKAEFYTPDQLEAYRTGSDQYLYPNVDWHKEVLRKSAPMSNYNLNFQGGNETIRYFVLLNILNSAGLYKKVAKDATETTNSRLSRYNFRSNIDVNLTKSLMARLTLGGTVDDKANPAGNDTKSTFDLMATVPPNSFPVYNPNGSFGGNNIYSNPLGNILEKGFYTSNGRTLQATLSLTQKLDDLTPGLSVSASLSLNNYFNSYSNKYRDYERFSIKKDVDNNFIYTKIGLNTSLSADESRSDQWRNYAFQSYLNYDRTFGRNAISAMLMYNSENYTISGNNLPFKHLGGGGRFTLVNSKRYIGEFSFGYMGSENFAKENRFGFFPAVSLGWIASNEGFLNSNPTINFLKIRGSYGLTGNDKIGDERFLFEQYYPYSAEYYFGTGNAVNYSISEGKPANKDITWEKDKKMNFGIEATLWKQLDVEFEYFNNTRYDILVTPNRTVPEYLGFTLPYMNEGEVSNKGFEASLRFNSKEGKSLQYFIEASAWYAKNTIEYMSEPIHLYNYQDRTGKSIGQPYVLESIGFFKDQADIDASPRQIFTTVKPGDLKYKDQNNDNVIDQNDYYPLGKTGLPEVTYTLRAGLNYKGFDLDMLFQGVTNRTIYLSGNYFYAFQNNAKISEIALGRWTPETATSATYPRLSAQNNLNNFLPSSFWQRDGSFIKLRSIELGYTIPASVIQKVNMLGARVFVNGVNLFSADKIDYTDPETLTGYPALRVISVGATIQF